MVNLENSLNMMFLKYWLLQIIIWVIKKKILLLVQIPSTPSKKPYKLQIKEMLILFFSEVICFMIRDQVPKVCCLLHKYLTDKFLIISTKTVPKYKKNKKMNQMRWLLNWKMNHHKQNNICSKLDHFQIPTF